MFMCVHKSRDDEDDYDPFAERKRLQKATSDKDDDTRQVRRPMVISPERIDPFAEGKLNF